MVPFHFLLLSIIVRALYKYLIVIVCVIVIVIGMILYALHLVMCPMRTPGCNAPLIHLFIRHYIYIMLVACLLGFLHLLHFLLIFFPYLSTCLLPPFPQIDIRAMVIVWRVRGKIIRSVLYNIMCNNCAQCNAFTYEQT